ncbi:MAG TPA: hypothetical protein EYH54_04555 [Nautiliaceae bacterium]|nr:hypothetical protein [Nautiliaceae bacterium]
MATKSIYEDLRLKQMFVLRELLPLFDGYEEVSISPFYFRPKERPVVLYTFPLSYVLENEDILMNNEQMELIFNIQKPRNLLVIEFDSESILENAVATKSILKFLQFDFLLLYTGNKSFHAWIPFNIDIYLSKIVNDVYDILNNFAPLDLELFKFDKQVFLGEKAKIRFPFTLHHKTTYPSVFIKKPLEFLDKIIEKGVDNLEELRNLLKDYSVNYEVFKIDKEVFFDNLLKYFDINQIAIENTKRLFNLLSKYGKNFSKLHFSINEEISFFNQKYEIKEKHEVTLFERRIQTPEGKEKIANKILSFIMQDLKDGKQRAVGILYALSVLLGKGYKWFIDQAKKLPYFEKVKSKVSSYSLHYDSYKNKEWVSWGWVFNRFKEIQKDNEVV